VADHPLRPATDRRFGRPLPHQLANRTQAPHSAHLCFPSSLSQEHAYAVLAPVSQRYPPPNDRFLRVTHPFATQKRTEVLLFVRLACLRYAASVCPEPGSNSPYYPSCKRSLNHSISSHSSESRSLLVKVPQTKKPPRHLRSVAPFRTTTLPTHSFLRQCKNLRMRERRVDLLSHRLTVSP
jgi:hypothetical protein